MAEPFLTSVVNAFSFLTSDPDHRLIDSEQGRSFDNAVVYFGSGRCRVRITRERGQVFADFAPADGPPHWFDAPLVLQYLGHQRIADAHSGSDQQSLDALAALVRAHYSEIAALYATECRDRTIGELRSLQEENSRLRWG